MFLLIVRRPRNLILWTVGFFMRHSQCIARISLQPIHKYVKVQYFNDLYEWNPNTTYFDDFSIHTDQLRDFIAFLWVKYSLRREIDELENLIFTRDMIQEKLKYRLSQLKKLIDNVKCKLNDVDMTCVAMNQLIKQMSDQLKLSLTSMNENCGSYEIDRQIQEYELELNKKMKAMMTFPYSKFEYHIDQSCDACQ